MGQIGKDNNNYRHGLRYHPFYLLWQRIKKRCYNPKEQNYKWYGGKGIRMYEPWLNDVVAFITYIETLEGANRKKHTLDRIDGNKNYEPGNLRWLSLHLQAINKDKMITNTSGYIGVNWHKQNQYWTATINYKKQIFLGCYDKIEEALEARNNYIIANNMPHKIQKIVN